ncbi:cyclic nucleotide-binding domain-containing protein [Saccharospirillum alexandrii]|uniref:cyclic nucleotide-binding domain-containing protein n=1 Tax=Saccharospirillum alexandrii TaxID=2448477 RepID=UPI003735EAA1
MLLLGERSPVADQLQERLRILADKLFEDRPEGQLLSLDSVTDLYASHTRETLFILRSGTLQGHQEERHCLYYEPGDVVGLSDCYQLPSFRISSDGPVELEAYAADVLLQHCLENRQRQSIWTSYLISLSALFMHAFGRYLSEADQQPLTGFLNFASGETIIAEGDPAHEVFTILTGRAEVTVAGAPVGEVLKDEIFGAMAVFTGEPRSATVIAAEPCTVLAVPKDQFISLIKSHPDTVLTLIENMARSIQSLNTQLTEAG